MPAHVSTLGFNVRDPARVRERAIMFSFITHAPVKTIAGKMAEVSGAVWLIAAASVVQFAVL